MFALGAEAAPIGAHLSFYGGNIVEHPTYVNVFWGAYWSSGVGLAQRNAMNDFTQTVGTSAEFNSVLEQYTGPGGVFPHVGSYFGEKVVSGEPGGSSKVISNDQVRTAIDSWIAAGLVPAPSLDVIYNIYFPAGVEITRGTDASNATFCTYHDTVRTTRGTGGLIRYVVMPFPNSAGCRFEPVLVDSMTVVLSHSMAEAVTDPDIGVAIDTNVEAYLGWYDVNNGEIGDICAGDPDATLLGYRVQPLWSNADGKCVATRNAADSTPPAISPSITGTLGSNGWYTSDVGISWSVSDPESAISSTTGCDATTVSSDTGPVTFTCTATSSGGTATQSITVKRDATKPAVTYSGNAGSYTPDQTVSISCVASDNLSGIASSTCAAIAGPAYGFNIGSNTFAASATDNAGNSAVAATTFTVTASPGSLVQLTRQFVQASPRYQALSTRQKSIVDRLVDATARFLAAILPRLDARQKAALINAYKGEVAALARAGWLTPSQAATLAGIASSL